MSETVIVGPYMKNLAATIEDYVRADEPVLLVGETGTGKSQIAKHVGSKFSDFREISCVDPGKEVFRSTLFGYEKYAYTGANPRGQTGLLEEIKEGGVLFLDEIAEIPSEIQATLLRLIQDHKFTRYGGKTDITTKARFIAATNRDVKRVESGFRNDLLNRFEVIKILPLWERRQDIPDMIQTILNKNDIQYIFPVPLLLLIDNRWNGNYRRLKRCLDAAIRTLKNSGYDSQIEMFDGLAITRRLLPYYIKSNFIKWIELDKSTGNNLRKRLCIRKTKILKITTDTFCDEARDLYIRFGKDIGYLDEVENDQRVLFKEIEKKGMLSSKVKELRGDVDEDDDLEVSDFRFQFGKLEEEEQLEIICSFLSKYRFKDLEKFYYNAVAKAHPKHSLLKLAGLTGVADSTVKAKFDKYQISR